MTGLLLVLFIILFIWLMNIKQDFDNAKKDFEVFKAQTERKISNLQEKIQHLYNTPAEKSVNIEKTIKQDIQPSKIIQTNQTENTNIKDLNENNQKPQSANKIYVKENYEEFDNIEKKQDVDFEKIFLGSIFSKIGGVALVIAICFLVKLSSQYIEFTPVLKISLGYIVSLILTGYSVFLYKKDENNITAQILSGVSISGLLLSTYFGCFFYSLFNIPVALSLAFLIAIVSYLISEKFDSFSTIAIGLLGGYLNPAVLNDGVSINILFGYLIALNLISVCYTYKNGSKNIINTVNIFLTLLTLAIFSDKGDVNIIYPIILWLLYIGYDILTSIQGIKQDNKNILRWFNFGALILITNQIFHFGEMFQIGITIFIIGILYTLLYFVFQKKDEEIASSGLQSAIFCLFFTTFYLVKNPYMGLAWAIEGFLVSELYLLQKTQYLRKFVYMFFVPAIVYLIINYQSMFDFNEGNFWGAGTLIIYLIQSGAMLYSSYRLKSLDNNTSNCLRISGYTIIYLFFAFFFNTKTDFNHYKLYINSILCSIYSLHSYKLLAKDYKDISDIMSNIFYVLSVLLLIVAESMTFNELDFIPFLNIKFMAYLLLIGLSIYYAKKKNEIFEYAAIITGMFSLIAQISCIFNSVMPSDAMPLTITISLIIYSGIILSFGILKNVASMKKTAICLILILLCKLILIDLRDIDAIFKLIAFIIIGALMLGISNYYQKKKID